MKALTLLLLSGCAAVGRCGQDDISYFDPMGSQTVLDADAVIRPLWPSTVELYDMLLKAQRRIYDASSIRVVIDTRMLTPDNAAVVFADQELMGDYAGFYKGQWIPISKSVTPNIVADLVLHEVMHTLGAAHVTQNTGLMSSNVNGNNPYLTTADLESLCKAQACQWMIPEGPDD